MRYSIAFAAMAAVATAQSPAYTNAFTSYLSETNSLGVVTGMPQVNSDVATSQAKAVTTQPAAVTTQPAVATVPAGTPSSIPTLATLVGSGGSAPLATGKSGSGASNGTVSTGTLKGSGATGKATSAGSPSSTASNVGGSGSSSGTTTAGSSSSSSTGKSSAGMVMVEPALGLGLAGALFALFL